MTGDERARHCAQCRLNVYNVENLSADEVRQLIGQKEGRVCFRFMLRKDGTLLTKDCPVGLAAVRRKMYLGFAVTVLFFTGFVGTLLNAMGVKEKPSCSLEEPGTLNRIVRKLDEKANVIRGIVPGVTPTSHMMGDVAPVRPMMGKMVAVPPSPVTKVE
jgi:hypothetical protein